MSEPRNHCPQCGAPLTSDAPQGLCPRCLLIGATFNTDAEVGPHGTKIVPPPPGIEAVRAAFPQLEVIELIGRGGMGVVYKARQKTLDRLVALKLLAPERVTDAHFAERFTREAQALARLSHPNIVTIHDFGVASAAASTLNPQLSTAFYFLLMEFVDGVNLRQAMKAGRFTPEQALAIVPPVCEALQFAHERGIVHRDIKPENLLLDKTGRVKIADFGIAKILGTDGSPLTRPADTLSPTGVEGDSATVHTAAGTPQYMAPEQRQQHGTDHRADIYSLGVVLYELLTGELPGAKLQPPSRRVQIDVRLDEIVLRALETKPELRYQTAGEFRTQVETLAPSTAAAPANAQENPLGNLLLRLAIPAMAFAMALFHPGNPLAWLALGIFAATTALLLPYLPWCVNGRWQRGGELSAPGPWKRGTRFGLLALMLAILGARVWMGIQNPSLPIQSSVSSDHRAFVLPIQLNGGQIIVLFGLFAGIAIFLRLRSRDGAQKVIPANAAPLPLGAPRRLWFAPAIALHLLYTALLVLLFSTVPALPQRMAIHFNADGAADGWASRTTHALFIAGLPLFITALFVGIAFLTPRFPKLVNIPRRDYWLAPERVRFTAALLLRWLLWLACLMTIFFGALHWIVLQANQTQPAKLSMSQMLPLVIGFLIGCMIWTTNLIMRFAETERYVKALLTSDPARRQEQRRKWARQIVIGVLIAIVLRTWVVGVYVIRNDSIAPELPADSRVLVWKLSHDYAPGDLVVYREEKLSYVGRVTGKDSEAILVNRNGVPDFRVRRETVAGKVISVLWRGSSNRLPTGPELPSNKNRPAQP